MQPTCLSFLLISAALLGGTAATQTPTLRAVTDIEANANEDLTPGPRQAITANTTIASIVTVTAAEGSSRAVATIGPSASHEVQLTVTASSTRMNLPGLPSHAQGLGNFDWQLPGPVRGWLVMDAIGSADTFSTSICRLSLTGPGINWQQFAAGGSICCTGFAGRVRAFIQSAGPYTLRGSFDVSADPSVLGRNITCYLGLILSFEPALPPVRQATYGSPCGLDLAITDDTNITRHSVNMNVSRALPGAPLVYVFGGRRANDPLPPCTALVMPVTAVGVLARSDGTGSLSFGLPGPLQSATFVVQAVSFDAAPQLRASHGIELQFVD